MGRQSKKRILVTRVVTEEGTGNLAAFDCCIDYRNGVAALSVRLPAPNHAGVPHEDAIRTELQALADAIDLAAATAQAIHHDEDEGARLLDAVRNESAEPRA